MAIQDVLRSFPAPPFGMPFPEGTGTLPPEPPNAWEFNAASMPDFPEFPFRTVMEIEDGAVREAPDPAVEVKGSFGPEGADGASVTGAGDGVNAVVVSSGAYRFTNLEADVRGDGLNDFDGIGAVIMGRGSSVIELNDSRITTAGVIRPCTYVRDSATLKVRRCVLTGEGGYVPEDYIPVPGPGMKKPPLGLQIDGTSRTHLSVGNSHAYFYDSTIIADGWAALSTDGCTDELYLEADSCDVLCRGTGYGVYADGGCIVRMNGCRIRSGSHAAIMAGDCRLTFDTCDVYAEKYAVMMHNVHGFTAEVAKCCVRDSRLTVGEQAFFVKSTNAYIGIDSTIIRSGSGVLVRSVLNEDSHATPVGEDETDLYGIKISLRKSDLTGDILHEDPQRTMAVKLTDSVLRGAVRNAYISFSGTSRWTATGDSEVCLVNVTDLSSLDAVPGAVIRAVCGKDSRLPESCVLPSGGQLIAE